MDKKKKHTSLVSIIDNSDSFTSSLFIVSEVPTEIFSFCSGDVTSVCSVLTSIVPLSWGAVSFSDEFSSCSFSFLILTASFISPIIDS